MDIQSVYTMTNAMIDFLAWFLIPFMVFVTLEWVLSLFKRG